MIKFTCSGKKPGQTMVGLGLSRLNCERLLKGQPILIDLKKDMGLPWSLEIALIGGEDETHIWAELEKAGLRMPDDPDKIHIDAKSGG